MKEMSNAEEVFETLFGEQPGEAVDGERDEAAEGTTKINWRQKLSSRKLWAAVLCAVFAVVTAIFGEDLSPEIVEVLKTGIYGLIAYIFGEGVVDVVRILGNAKVDAASAVPININFGEKESE